MLRFLRQQAMRWLLFMAVVEFLLLDFAVYCALRLRYVGDEGAYRDFAHGLFSRGTLFACAMVLGMLALGMYQAQMRESTFGTLVRQTIAFAIGSLFLVIVYYLIPQVYIGRGVFALAVLVGFVLVRIFRLMFLNLMDTNFLKRRVVVYGTGHRAAFIAHWLRRNSDRRSFAIVGYVPVPVDEVVVPVDKHLNIGSSLHAWAIQHHIDEIVVGPDDRRGNLPMDDLLECKHHGIDVVHLVQFLERESGKVELTAYPSWLVFSDGFDASPLRRISKRAFDVFATAVVLALTWPLMLLVTLAIRIESGAGQPILYRQDRVGERGRVFSLVKFRSMRTDAELDGVARWASKNDDRVTRVGRFIRKVRLDELPQLWNVLKGNMSIIGPRPERPQFVEQLSKKVCYYSLRHCVKPGLAGWAQLRYPYGASEEDAAEKLTFDLFYVKNHNFRFDLMIFIQTLEVVLFARGAR
ncbi:MAG TPA: TIGR03013 family XrtA/PEP-CTERM system glycosyltransferase [Rudaea sp.]|jgi:sugar transferase (PEP-CTERM system associated)|nr:TIGR03013 family XrtA/PEP-CTERM system glycosyltransferase [Rudaea sp.]